MITRFCVWQVWVSDPHDGFVQGRIIDLTEEGALVQAVKDGRKVTTSFDRLYPAEDNDAKEVDDNCGLMYLNEATLLNNIRLRYQTQHLWYLILDRLE